MNNPYLPGMAADEGRPTVDVRRSLAVAGAMFLMAMSAAGPGFISQTGTFTARYGPSFAAAIVASVAFDCRTARVATSVDRPAWPAISWIEAASSSAAASSGR